MIRLIVIFIILLLALFFSSDALNIDYKKRRKYYILITTLLLILHSGLRHIGVGPDTFQYNVIFENARGMSWNEIINNLLAYEGKEPFYDLFQKVFQYFSTDYQIYLLFVATIFMPALGYFIYKNTTRINQIALAYVIYMGNFYGFFSITGIRQTIATAILLWSYKYIIEKKFIKFAVLVVFASLFHVTALVFILLYFISEIKKPKFVFRLAVFGFPIFLFFKNQIAVFFVSFIELEDRFGVYADQYEKGGSVVLTMLHVFLALWAVVVFKKMLQINPTSYRMYNMFALALFFFPLQWVNPSAGRIAQYFTIIIMVWIPYLIDASSIGNSQKRELYYFIATVGLITISLFAISVDEYKFFWQEMDMLSINN